MKSFNSSAVVLVGNGSRVAGFEGAMRRAARALQKRLKGARVRPAFLEIHSPTIDEAVDACVAAGIRTVRILPYFLLTGRHVREDIPKIVREARKRHRGRLPLPVRQAGAGRQARVRILLCPYLGFDSKIVDVLVKRLKAAR